MEKDNLVANAAAMGARLLEGSSRPVGKKRIVGECAGRGLLCAPSSSSRTARGGPLRQGPGGQLDGRRGTGGGDRVRARQVVRLAPPLCITREEVDQLVDIVAGSIAELEAELA